MSKMKLESIEPPYFYILVGSTDEFGKYAYRLNYEKGCQFSVRIVRGHKMQRLEDLFNEFAAALQFPDYFGENWAALEDCLFDLEWLRAEGYVLMIPHAAKVLSDDHPEERAVLIRTLLRTCKYWATKHMAFPSKEIKLAPFHVLFHATGSEVELVRQFLSPESPNTPVIPLSETPDPAADI